MNFSHKNIANDNTKLEKSIKAILTNKSTALPPQFVDSLIALTTNSSQAQFIAKSFINILNEYGSHTYAVYKTLFLIQAILRSTNQSHFYAVITPYAHDIRLVQMLTFESRIQPLRGQIHSLSKSIYDNLVLQAPLQEDVFDEAVLNTVKVPFKFIPNSNNENDSLEAAKSEIPWVENTESDSLNTPSARRLSLPLNNPKIPKQSIDMEKHPTSSKTEQKSTKHHHRHSNHHKTQPPSQTDPYNDQAVNSQIHSEQNISETKSTDTSIEQTNSNIQKSDIQYIFHLFDDIPESDPFINDVVSYENLPPLRIDPYQRLTKNMM